MSSSIKIPDFDANLIISDAENIATATPEFFWNNPVKTVLSVCCDSPELFPTLKRCNSRLEYISKWLKKYCSSYNNRPSKRTSKKIGTVPDGIIDVIISARLPDLNSDNLNKILSAHRLAMSAENILGSLLEEYLAEKLLSHGWYCAWGETMDKVDFCTKQGDLLQIKNRSNSENSSSSSVRKGTTIRKWHRINARNGVQYWKELNHLIGCSELSEEGFSAFVRKAITENPAALYVENSNYWQLLQD
ncbi:SinI family restriction endonuclease [Chroococcidiopsis thermalis]|uniref:Restriction endonuclease, type II, SinI n=1 Tax=Chroococcidiopsis thermalis (strain PCC 7203) TaxID=251229 RepID=K9U853_CHRTP|nr:SinI family restriction endonuclease [Chroococcidiopsis thermalis]AFY90778.1 Restriction endonuclease, type II, SinI [Chroococcidiopsis thermalis PCC 7203]